MRIGVPKETAPRERRVAIVPDVVKRLRAAEHDVVVEPGAGLHANAPDAAYEQAGATLGDPWGADVVAKVAPVSGGRVSTLLILSGPGPQAAASRQSDTIAASLIGMASFLVRSGP